MDTTARMPSPANSTACFDPAGANSPPISPILGRDFIGMLRSTFNPQPSTCFCSFRQQIGDERLFLLQLVFRGGDFRPAEIVQRHALDNFPTGAVGADGVAEHQALFDAVTAIRMHGHAEPVARRRGVRELIDRVDGGVGRAGGAAQPARLDDGRAALLHDADKILFQPFAVADDVRHGPALNFRVEEIGIHRGAVVAPDGQVADGGDVHAGLLRELRLGAVFIQRGHGEEAVLGHAGRVVGGDERIGVARDCPPPARARRSRRFGQWHCPGR